MDRKTGRALLLLAAILSTALVAFLSYSPILNCFFTGTDTLSLIETSRINSGRDLVRIFTEPLMAGTRFVDIAKFYRPLASLSYAFDYSIWKLEPFGFHLTDLCLHGFVSVLVVFILRCLTRGDIAAAWVGGIIFATHPILVESVPSIDRRHDMLAVLFVLLSVMAFVKSRSARAARRPFLILSLVAYVLALTSKEIAIMLPLLILGQRLLCQEKFPATGCAFLVALRATVPFFVVSFLYVGWRLYVLGCLGGYNKGNPVDTFQATVQAANIVHSYILDLLYPVNFLGIVDAGYGCTAFLIVALSGYLAIYSWRGGSKWGAAHNRFDSSLVTYFAGWLLLPLLLFELTSTFAHRNMYLSVVPFSGLLACTIVGSARYLLDRIPSWWTNWNVSEVPMLASRIVVLVVGIALTGSLVAYSPLLHRYKGWEDSARISSIFLTKLVIAASGLPKNCVIDLYGLPDRIVSYARTIPHSKDVAYLQDYSIKSWLNMHIPGNGMKVSMRRRSKPDSFTGSLNLNFRALSHTKVRAVVEVGKTGYKKFRRELLSRRNSSG